MRDIDPQLMRLREVEARIAFAECHVRDQEELVRRPADDQHECRLARALLETMYRTLELLRERQAMIFDELKQPGARTRP